ncbi:MAG: hypothetical protein UU73_C0002G0105 [Candidatus Daviesbacteria bacterium GW2011_GWA1_41_61]|nr:MAG: hypothetical protein UU26_C0019G0017 [Candidatus Daviesbacteria bacterium GW2011_GWC1_40_9]KKR93765.1 MAG: hypothetical protein UU44_C0001G0105 [Candidatus Daviesbacteria bacterium GW2011_GWB1_41_15]KKS15231.1 MAG: hypothetical protein UU73_C0002G0105 [Candidatus Daviesbacteria bacterium GW2011_GWA1_41_61]
MASSQQFIPLEEIRDDLVFLKNGSVSLIISTSAVNFSLLFETEQISIIQSFAGLLNSLSFPIQIIIRSKRLDITSYIERLKMAAQTQTNPLLAQMTQHYFNFVTSIIKENNVLDKQFYVCLNVSSIELGVFHKGGDDLSKKVLTILIPRRDHLLRQLSQLGLKARQLKSEELIKLFYDIYNPSNTEGADTPYETPLTPKAPPQLAAISPQPANPTAPSSSGPVPSTPRPPTIPFLPSPNNRPPMPPLNRSQPQASSISAPVIRLTPPFVVEELADDSGP